MNGEVSEKKMPKEVHESQTLNCEEIFFWGVHILVFWCWKQQWFNAMILM